MELTEQQLMLLEQLTYIDTDVSAEASSEGHPVKLNTESKTVGELLQPFFDNETALTTLQNSDKASISGGMMQGNEWAAIIRAINEDDDLRNLQIKVNYTQKPNQTIDNIIFTEQGGDPNQAIVAFRGTLEGLI